jgi:amino acid transporter
MSAVMVLIGVVLLVSTLARGGGRWPSACCSACSSSPPARAPVPARGGRLGVPTRPRAAGALRDHLHLGRRARSTSRSAWWPQRALGLTPFVYVLAGIFFALACTTYVEGASLHQDRGGRTGLRRYAFNELVSFVAGWMILLDYIILIAVTSFSATNYLAAFYAPLGAGPRRAAAVLRDHRLRRDPQHRGFSKTRVNRIAALVVADLGLQALVIVLGLFAFFHLDTITDTIHFGDTPTWGDTCSLSASRPVSFTGLESASGCRARSPWAGAGLKRLVGAAAIIVMVVYTGIGIVGRHGAARGRQRDLARAQLPRRADDRHRRVLQNERWPTR